MNCLNIMLNNVLNKKYIYRSTLEFNVDFYKNIVFSEKKLTFFKNSVFFQKFRVFQKVDFFS